MCFSKNGAILKFTSDTFVLKILHLFILFKSFEHILDITLKAKKTKKEEPQH